MFALASSAQMPADVPFSKDFRETMTIELRNSFTATIQSVISILRDEHGQLTGYVSVARPVHRVALRPAAS